LVRSLRIFCSASTAKNLCSCRAIALHCRGGTPWPPKVRDGTESVPYIRSKAYALRLQIFDFWLKILMLAIPNSLALGKDDRFKMAINFRKIIERQFLAGLAVLLPIGLTLYIVWVLFNLVSNSVSPLLIKIALLEQVPVVVIRIIAVLITFVIIWIIGLVATNIVGRKIIRLPEALLLRAPVVNRIYQTLRQIIQTIIVSKTALRQVVLVEYPRKGVQTVAFVTNIYEEKGKRKLSLLIPTTPNPTTGFFLIVPEEEVIPLKMTVEEAMKLIVSAGIITPENYSFEITKNNSRD